MGDCSFTTPWNTLCSPSSLHFAAWLFKSLWYDSGWLLAPSVLLLCLMQINHAVSPVCSSACSCTSTIRVDDFGRERFPRRRICWDMLEAISSCQVACRFLLMILSTNSCLLQTYFMFIIYAFCKFCWIFSFITTLGLSQKFFSSSSHVLRLFTWRNMTPQSFRRSHNSSASEYFVDKCTCVRLRHIH